MLSTTSNHNLIAVDQLRYTIWLNAETTTPTQYGNVSNQKWLELEKERIEGKGGVCTIYRHHVSNKLCLVIH